MNMNEHDALQATIDFDESTPNLMVAAATLYRLVEWTNANSDGWPYWAKPRKAAARLEALVAEAYRRRRSGLYSAETIDCEPADVKKALTPVKAFLTRQGVDHREVV